MDTGEKIVRARKEKGLTQKALAEKLGIKAPALLQWEKGLRTPTTNTLNKIAHALEVSVVSLLPDRSLTPEEAEYEEKFERYLKGDDLGRFIDLLESVENINLVTWGYPWEPNGYIIEYKDNNEEKIYNIKITRDEMVLLKDKIITQMITEIKFMHPSGEDSRAVFQLDNKKNRLE